jgi:hypothetical protein
MAHGQILFNPDITEECDKLRFPKDRGVLKVSRNATAHSSQQELAASHLADVPDRGETGSFERVVGNQPYFHRVKALEGVPFPTFEQDVAWKLMSVGGIPSEPSIQ